MASTYLSKTFSAGNRKTWTWSGWLKVSNPDLPDTGLFSFYGDDNNFGKIGIQGDNNQFAMYSRTSTIFNVNIQSSAVARDCNGWYHIVWSVDTTQATASDRVKLYINGTLQTSFVSSTYPNQNTDLEYNTTNPNYVGTWKTSSQFFDGLMSDVYFIDGIAYDASTFGSFDSTTGIWKPNTAPTVTYGTNGFNLKFTNGADAGEDFSGNNNDFATNGTPTQTLDCPSNVFATGNPLQKEPPAFANGNLTYSNGAVWRLATSTLAVSSGKYYAEFKIGSNNTNIGIITTTDLQNNTVLYTGQTANSIGMDPTNGNKIINNVGSSYGTASSANDIISVALDLDNNYLYFATNGVWQNSGVPTSGATGTGGIAVTTADLYCFGSSQNNTTNHANYGNGFFGTTAVVSAGTNAGIGTFEYDVPAGYYALCTKNINTQEYS